MKKPACLLVFLLFAGMLQLAAQARPKDSVAIKKQPGVQYGTASYYSNKFQGKPTASGEPYDKTKMTCAHNSLPLGTWVKVTNLRNKRTVIVQVNDRLHHKNKRVVDLSGAAAAQLGYVKRGLARVKVQVVNNADAPK